jgi:lipid-A-disaccharide synthase
MSKTIMISAGEASGDLHAANLVKSLHKIDPNIKITGMGGEKLRQVGASPLIDCSDIAVVGITEVLFNYRKILKVLNQLRDQLRSNPPDLLILVDYQEFNFKLAATAKECGVKVLFYISPQVWAWRPHRVHKIGKLIDMMAVLFPFEEKFYKEANVPVRFVGHPLVDEAKATKTKQQAINEYQLNTANKVVGLFPGSRKGEIKRVLPVQLETATLLKKTHPDLQFILPMASTLDTDDFADNMGSIKSLNIKLVKDNPYDVMQICDAIISASGTATLEMALMGIPNVITYKVSPLTFFIISRMITIEHIGLVNIISEESVIKEFIQNNARADNIAHEVNKILTDNEYRNTMIEKLDQVKAKLGKKGGSDNIAQLAYEMLVGSPPSIQ